MGNYLINILQMIKGIAAATINPLFLQHVAEHGLNFGTTEEFNFRQGLFMDKDAKYAEINADPTNTFVVGHNSMSTWTHDEYKVLLGYKTQANFDDLEVTELDEVNVPSSVDWRQKGAVNAIKNQGQCGSCWAFSATCSIEGHYQIASGHLVSLAEQELVDCDTKCHGCNGGLQYLAMQYVASYGQTLEQDYKYTGKDGRCNERHVKKIVKTTKLHQVKGYSSSALISAIAAGPVSVTVDANESAFQGYRSGILNTSRCGTSLDHAITAVGYGKSGSETFYIIRNSWGGSWGEGGYIRIAAQSGHSKGICGIQQQSVWSDVKAA